MAEFPIEVRASRQQRLGMPVNTFLRDYWQQRPLLVRGAFAPWRDPLSAEDLAGLACEDLALARLIRLDRKRNHWSVERGPFDEQIFPALPKRDWTVLVQDVDKWDPDVRQLLDVFEFLPRWRIDDVMVSFAAPGGSVGPHTDHYDVFLIQGSGQRRWQLDLRGHAARFRQDSELKLLENFQSDVDWLCQPGDMLYLPPEVPHFGEATSACLTFSIGFRAPSRSELLADLADHLETTDDGLTRFADPGRQPVRDSGRIEPDDLDRVRDLLRQTAELSDAALSEWFGRAMTRYRNPGLLAAPPKAISKAQLIKRLQAGTHLVRHPFTRLAWRASRPGARLYALGDALSTSTKLASTLCGSLHGDLAWFEQLSEDEQQIVLQLVNTGHLAIERA
ncbi:cupin domain-containing protein [Pseudomarimonas arenosa]|uniref:Cupin domain-containing protein n=1 Tax=Pseudomarimonas arenosa TaxID=2774145 RepID=A0AAW3ZLE6_9GAMM|nr:cupin domain-containing protein [Pseudomarimonas arenosa]MBD8526935.1 cupin domain-containing protein [Pseudomarimonas arenosa]